MENVIVNETVSTLSSAASQKQMSLSFVSSMYLYLTEGTVITVTNSLLLACILGKKKNRERREFLLIGVQALADTFYAIAFMLIALHRLHLAAEGKENSNSTVWNCAISPALPLHNWATPLLGLLPLTTSVNFFLCSMFPLWYLKQTELYTFFLILVPHLISIILSVLNYVLLWGDHSPTPAACVAAKGAAHPLAYGIMLALRIFANFGSAMLYAAILMYLRRARNSSLTELTAQQRKTHRNATITLGCVTTNSVLLLFIPDVLLFFNPFNINVNYSTLLYSMTLSKTTINFFIYMWRYKELKDMVWTMTCRRIPQLRKYFPERISTVMGAFSGVHSKATLESRPTATEDSKKAPHRFQNAVKPIVSVAVLNKKIASTNVKDDLEVGKEEEWEGIQEKSTNEVLEKLQAQLQEREEERENEKEQIEDESPKIQEDDLSMEEEDDIVTEEGIDISRFWYNI